MHRNPLLSRARCVAVSFLAVFFLGACNPPPPLSARPTGDAFSTEPLYHDGAPWTAPGVEAALNITSSEPRFGGWSGLAVHDDQLTAVSDRGYWFRVLWSADEDDDGVVLSEPKFGVLKGLDGEVLRRGQLRDAEEILALPDGGHIVAFEREHRLWLYPEATPPLSAAPSVVAPPERLDDLAGYNSGIEAMARLPDGRLIALLEGETGRGTVTGWIGTPQGTPTDGMTWDEVTLAVSDGYRPTGAAVAANGDLLVLERYFSIPLGFSSRIRRIPADDLRPGATLDGPVAFRMTQPPINDNFEGIAAVPLPDGATRVLVISDDNYSGLQRTLLLSIRLETPRS